MPILKIFGIDVGVTQVQQTTSLAPGLSLTSSLAADGSSIGITLDGHYRQVTFEQFGVSLACRVKDGVVMLSAGTTDAIGTLRILSGSIAQADSAPTVVVPVTPQKYGFDVRHHSANVRAGIQGALHDILFPFAGYHDLDRWTGSLVRVRIDRDTVGLVLEDARPELRLDDRFGDFGATSLLQRLRLREARLNATGFTIHTMPRNHALFLNPDILDGTSAIDTLHNAMLFQHVLAGVDLVGSYEYTNGFWKNIGWQVVPDQEDGRWTLAVNALQDEQGHPLMLQSDAAIPLTVRWGLDKPEPGSGLNRAIVLGARAGDLALPVTVISADAAALYGRHRFPAPLNASREIPVPYWVEQGLPAVLQARPRELNRLARNLALRTATGMAPLSATLRLSPRMDGNNLIAMLPSLVFDSSPGMMMAFDVPEQSVVGASAQLERRIAPASGQPFNLPLLDVRWAFGDLACRGDVASQLAVLGASWIDDMDRNLTGQVFPAPAMSRYQHTGGHRAAPVMQSFARLLPVAPVRTGAATSRLGERMAPVEATLMGAKASTFFATGSAPELATPFLFGGPPDGASQALDDAALALDLGRAALGDVVERFHRFWTGVETPPSGIAESDWGVARRALRAFLAGEPADLEDPANWTFEQLMDASARLEAARGVLAAGAGAVLEFDGLDVALEDAMPDEVEELRNPAALENTLARLFQYAFAPPSMAFLKRAVSCVLKNPPPQEIKDYVEILREVVTTELIDALDAVFRGADAAKRLQGMFAELTQGVAGPYAYLADIWSNPRGALKDIVEELRTHYGPVLTKEVLNALLASPEDARALLERLQGLGFALARLDDLTDAPPEYLLVTRRLRHIGASNTTNDSDRLHPIERAAALWNHRFDFCTFGGGKAWDLFLDDDTTLVVKLGSGLSLDAILTELHQTYQTPRRDDPFGLAGLSTASGDPLQNFLTLLPEPLRQPSWCGVLIINPMIDLERDEILTTLCGFPHIAARFAAVGGARPKHLDNVQLDVWGRIENTAAPDGWSGADGRVVSKEPGWGKGDVGWSMTRFVASIKNTTVLSGEIGFRLEFRELFGRQLDGIVRVNIGGTLPPMPSGQSTGGKPREFKFVGTLEKPLEVPVEVAFIKALQLRGVRIGSHDGDTTLDIDADLLCREWPIGGFTFDPPKGPVSLSNMRIRMPRLDNGLSLPMGLRRALSIDLGAIQFPVMQERTLTVAGIELRPVGIGMLRGTGGELSAALEASTMQLARPDFSDGDTARYVYPFLDTRVDFGKTPILGGGSQLSLVARVGTPIAAPGTDAKIGGPGAGLASLNARDLKLDLFRLVTIEAASVEVKTVDVYDPDTDTLVDKAGTFAVDGFNLKIGGWSLFAETDKRLLLMAHTHRGARGMLAWYAAPNAKGGFFRLQWLLVCRNLDPGKHLKDGLLSSSPPSLDAELTVINGIMPASDPARLYALVEKDAPWLFGVRFELGELFSPCSLVLQDGRYYGIRLGGIVAKLLTGEDDFSFAYIPGPAPEMDRFRTTFRCAALDMIGTMRSGDMALEWSPNWDFLIDAGQPWRGPSGYQWERAFSMPVGVYEAKFGFFIEKRTSLIAPNGLSAADSRYVTFSAGAGFYLGYFFELNAGIAWVRAGIGIFGVLIGSATLRLGSGGSSNPLALLRGTLMELRVVGVIGIYAYGEGGIEVWVLSARFRVSAQAFVEVTLVYVTNARSVISWNAMLSASYSASVRIGSGWFSWTFRVSGSVQMQINGQAAFG